MEMLLFLLGWLSFNAMTFLYYKNKIDNTPELFTMKQYWIDSWDDWVITLIIAIPLFILRQDLFLLLLSVGMLPEGIFWSNKIPYILGAFGTMIFQGTYDIIKLTIERVKNKIKKKIK